MQYQGGKEKIAARLVEAFPDKIDVYVEPFVCLDATSYRQAAYNYILADGNEALMIALIISVIALFFSRRTPAQTPKEPPITPPEIDHAKTHKMDDDAAPAPAATHSAEQLRKWARGSDDVRDKE